MNRINRSNYEAFMLDYLEGYLSAEDYALFLEFLDANPDLKAELDQFESIKLAPDTNLSFDKSSLKKNISEDQLEDFIIASLENEISQEDALELDEYLSSSESARNLKGSYRKTYLERELIPFPHKDKIRKKNQLIYYLAPALSAAAAILLFIIFYQPEHVSQKEKYISKHQGSHSIDQKSTKKDLKIALDKKKEKKTAAITKKKLNASVNFEDSKQGKIKPSKHSENKDLQPEIQVGVVPKPNNDLSVNNKVDEPETKPDVETLPEKESESDIIPDSEKKQKKELPEQKSQRQEPDVLRPGQWLAKTFRKKILKTEMSGEESKNIMASTNKEPTKENSSKLKVDYKENDSQKTVNISIGKFEYTRIKSR